MLNESLELANQIPDSDIDRLQAIWNGDVHVWQHRFEAPRARWCKNCKAYFEFHRAPNQLYCCPECRESAVRARRRKGD